MKSDSDLIGIILDKMVDQQRLIGDLAVKVADLVLFMSELLPKCQTTDCNTFSVGTITDTNNEVKNACKKCLHQADKDPKNHVLYSGSYERIQRLESTIHSLREKGYFDPSEMN
jgi:hypothetical protein